MWEKVERMCEEGARMCERVRECVRRVRVRENVNIYRMHEKVERM